MNGLHSKNIISVAKYFPGHGDIDIDSHVGLPKVNKSLSDLEQFEIKPFKALIDSGVEMVMAAHIELPQIENNTVVSKKEQNDERNIDIKNKAQAKARIILMYLNFILAVLMGAYEIVLWAILSLILINLIYSFCIIFFINRFNKQG